MPFSRHCTSVIGTGRIRPASLWLRLLCAGLLLAFGAASAQAAIWYDPESDIWFWKTADKKTGEIRKFPLFDFAVARLAPRLSDAAPVVQRPGEIFHSVYQIDNSAFTLERGEPNPGGLMQRTVWRRYVPDRSGRVVFNTYGSARFGGTLDTVIAVYRVTGPAQATLVASNDNTFVAGGNKTTGWVQFNAVKGTEYAVQVGTKGTVGGDVVLTSFAFPAAGGLTVQPLTPIGGYNYFCLRNLASSGRCPDAGYVVYNATAKPLTVTVTASARFGPGIVLPAPFTLAPGAAAVKTIAFTNAFGGTQAATTSGGFIFSGTNSSTLLARTIVPATTVMAASSAPAAKLEVKATAKVLSGATGEVFTQTVAVRNAGATGVTGCYVGGFGETLLQRTWVTVNPATGAATGDPYAPFNIAPGKTVTLRIGVRSLRDRLADPAFATPYEIFCASAASFPAPGRFDLSNKMDFSANVRTFPRITLVGTSPASGVQSVPAGGAVTVVAFRNDGTEPVTLTAKVAERSIHPFGGPTRYRPSVCPPNTTQAACVASTATTITVTAAPGQTFRVKVGLKRPAQDPGFAPDTIGYVLTLEQPYSDVFSVPVPLAGVTKALKRG